MKRALLLLPLLAACGTPQEQCINAATRDLRVVEQLIAKSELNLKRGYGYESVTISRVRWVQCVPATKKEPARMCLDDVVDTVQRPKAIDLDAEARTLAQLKAKRTALMRDAAPAIAQCQATYPE